LPNFRALIRGVERQYLRMPSIPIALLGSKILEPITTQPELPTTNLLKLAWSIVARQFISADAFQFQLSHQQDDATKDGRHVEYDDIELCSSSQEAHDVKGILVADILRDTHGAYSRNENGVQGVEEELAIPEQRIWSRLQILLGEECEIDNHGLGRKLNRVKETSLPKV